MEGGTASLKATGIVRRIDDLGRVVIPKEIRRTLRIREGDPLEIFVERGGEVILKKYSPIGEVSDFAQEYADSLNESTGHTTLITDRDVVVAVAGESRKQWLGKEVPAAVEQAMVSRATQCMLRPGEAPPEDQLWDFGAWVAAPIIAEGDPVGVVVLGNKDPGVSMGELEQKLAETAAGFLAKQMEQ
jgi:AbrB family transcriptional regulator (stage V sporulation protein T)